MLVNTFSKSVMRNKPGVALVVLAIAIGGISAQAAENNKNAAGGYFVCVDSKTNVITFPDSNSCAKGDKKVSLGDRGDEGAKGPKGAIGPTGPAGATGATGAQGLTGAAGADGATGPAGIDGAVGATGPAGIDGAVGATGTAGATGAQGLQGLNAPATQYAEGVILVSRGAIGSPAPWATYSTALGSPYGDTAGGTFRFTCRTAPCVVSLAAQSTTAGVTVFPRVMIYKSDINTGQILGQCEYGDGATRASQFAPVNTVGTTLLTLSAASLIPINIGGSLDCGAGNMQVLTGVSTDPTFGDVSFVVVPAGYYDVQSSFTFKG